MSYIDLHGNTLWTEHEIDARTVALIRSRYSQDDESRLLRLLMGQQLGIYQMSEAEQQEVPEYQAWAEWCREQGRAASAANELLRQAVAYETAERRLVQPLYDGPATIDADGEQIPNPDYERDQAERAAASLTLQEATAEVLALVEQRRAVVVEEAPAEEPIAEGGT